MAPVFQTCKDYAAIRSVQLTGAVLFALFMFVSLGWRVGIFFRQVQNSDPVSTVAAPPAASERISTEPSKTLLQLFGGGLVEATDLAEMAAPLPESNLNIHVSAIFFQSTPEGSLAVVEDGDNTVMLKSGGEVRPGIVVRRIESHRITLERGGKFEQISFRGFGADSAVNPAPISLPLAQTTPDVPAAPAGEGVQQMPAAYQQYIQRKLAQNK